MFKSITLTILIFFLACYVKAQEKKSIDAEAYNKTGISRNEQVQIVEKLNKFRKNKKLDNVNLDSTFNKLYFEWAVIGSDINNIDTLRKLLRLSLIYDYNIDFVNANTTDFNDINISTLQKRNTKLSNCLSDTTFNRIFTFQDPQNTEKTKLIFIKNYIINFKATTIFTDSNYGFHENYRKSYVELSGISFKKDIRYSYINECDLPKLQNDKDYYYSLSKEIQIEDNHFLIDPEYSDSNFYIIWSDSKEILLLYNF